MICTRCTQDDHKRCDDKLHDRRYRSCDCQHRSEREMLIKDEPTGDPTDC